MKPRKLIRALFYSFTLGAVLSLGSSPIFREQLQTLAAKPGQIANEWRSTAIAQAKIWAIQGKDAVLQKIWETVHGLAN